MDAVGHPGFLNSRYLNGLHHDIHLQDILTTNFIFILIGNQVAQCLTEIQHWVTSLFGSVHG